MSTNRHQLRRRNGVRLATASTGAAPVVFIHELAGDLRNWELQVQAFSVTIDA